MDVEPVVSEPHHFPQRHPMAHRNREEVPDALHGADCRRVASLHGHAADGVGAVEHHHRLAAARRLLQQQYGGRRIAVVAGTDVLQVHEHDVDAVE